MSRICRAIFNEICVLANGDVVCSCGDPAARRVYGNIREKSVEEIYRSISYRSIRRYQLSSEASCYCPVIKNDCAGRVYSATDLHNEYGLSIKTLQLEPTSLCNLNCPGCPVSNFNKDKNYRSDRKATLAFSDMLNVVCQLPKLKHILYYNFGEPFLHPDSIAFFKAVKKNIPFVEIYTSTNGIPLTPNDITAIVEENLLQNIVFSIDGSCQDSYRLYRRGGSFKKAFSNMQFMRSEIARCNAESSVRLYWQYILFEWNDGDKEIAEAKRLSSEYDIPIRWVLTHTQGKSNVYTPSSSEYKKLVGSHDCYEQLTCELQAEDFITNGSKNVYYMCDIVLNDCDCSRERILLNIEIKNTSNGCWKVGDIHFFRLGIQVIDGDGDSILELGGRRIYRDINIGDIIDFSYEESVDLPKEAKYIMVDMVHEQICWFHDRASKPLIIRIIETTRH
ncbi:MAG: radical SAM protein [Candidatus Hodarchaeales archaeon]|jgi:molybdenum cofactor biosynthesis enzyme MoaA